MHAGPRELYHQLMNVADPKGAVRREPWHPDRVVNTAWPPHLPVTSVRIARPTARLEACTTFYRDQVSM